ncbi:hypothetical protein N7539_004410 [Penicillium diatomitis]|uniref:Uncharacterized protein n=1 Tax=Penicillium diatomitis TaxID=2819901 RepID=A0A9X0BY80_9EURO|nr:uncharacterized protein N7539_004410 [Penicillium diatomitis]KAJ5489520.1 hypothetical protein N7539_004410 [Penicillium diatomitis]
MVDSTQTQTHNIYAHIQGALRDRIAAADVDIESTSGFGTLGREAGLPNRVSTDFCVINIILDSKASQMDKIAYAAPKMLWIGVAS